MKSNRTAVSFLASLLLCCGLTGCGDMQDPALEQPAVQTTVPGLNQPSELIADPMAEIKPQPVYGRDADDTYLIAQTGFALGLMQKAMQSDANKNILLSPYSAMQALAMTANGAANQTLAEMEQALGGIPIDTLNEYLYTSRTCFPENENCKFNIANSIWVRDEAERISPDPAFLQKNADYYAADVFLAPFDESTRGEINSWCSKRTDSMIPEILSEPIGPDTVMYLINAVCFDAKREEIYEDEPTPRDFHAANGETRTVQMMYSQENMYLSDAHAVGFLKNYQGGNFAFAAILPDEGITPEQYLANLTPEDLHSVLTHAERCDVNAGLPQFSYDYDNELSEELKAMGMTSAFDDQTADFYNITGTDKQLYINRVLHKTHIEVDTEGTKAAAVTAVEMADEAAAEAPENMKTVILDRPFVYMIVDTNTMLPVFFGILNEIP